MKNIIIKILSVLYTSKFSGSYFLNKRIINSLLDNLGYSKGILLDIGSGNSPYKYIFQKNVTKYITLDRVDTTVVNFIKPDIEGDILNIQLEDNSIDTVLCTQVLEHVNEPKKAVEELYRVLKKGGYGYITIPLTYPIHMDHDYFRYTYKGIKYLCESCGFETIKIVPHGYFFTGIFVQINHYLHSLFMLNIITKILFIIFTPIIYLIININDLLGYLLDIIFPKNIDYSYNYLIIVKK